MKNPLPAVALHPLLFAAYPVLALYAVNVNEVSPGALNRPLLISLAGAGILYALASLLYRSTPRGALVASLWIVLFFAYGHAYAALRDVPAIGFQVARHRFLFPLFAALLLAGWWALSRLKNPPALTLPVNAVALLLVALPLGQIAANSLQVSRAVRSTEIASQAIDPLQPQPGQALPDIYYIVLDMHTRPDALLSDYGLDVSPFLEEMQALGFYHADCSQPNYDYTQASLVAGLNYHYVHDLTQAYQALGDEGRDPWVLIQNSLVRRQLEAIGYMTVAFQTTYAWSNIEDADVFLGENRDPVHLQMLTPFESMWIKSTAALALVDSQILLARSQLQEINYPFRIHVNAERFILDNLPQIASLPEPTFTFAHILIPHFPFVFRPDGSLQTDPGFYGGEKASPVDEPHKIQGYTDGVRFIDSQILAIVRTILERSTTPPIIIIQGDHGYEGENRFRILNLVYLNPEGRQRLYPSISPVNTFRVVFNTTFGMDYPLLEDKVYAIEDWQHPVVNNASRCKGIE